MDEPGFGAAGGKADHRAHECGYEVDFDPHARPHLGSGSVQGWISQSTGGSRIRRALSCVYCDPYSSTKT